MNPFPAHAPVTGADLCDREDILEEILEAARAGRPVAVAGPPGAGLTSLAREAAARLERGGRPAARLGLATLADPGELRAPGGASRTGGSGHAPGAGRTSGPLLIDDAHRLAEGGAGSARKALDLAADGRTPLLFGHDGPALVSLLGPGADGRLLEIGPLPFAAWLPYALERFLESDVWVSNDQVEAAYRASGGLARHLQDLFHELWDLAGGRGGRVEDAMVDRALGRVLARGARAWQPVWESLTPNQRRFLRAVARAGQEAHPFSAAFLERSGLGPASSAQRAAASLEARGLLARTPDDALRTTDPLLGRWLAGEGRGDA
ncbi:MAG TPA: MarR family transcriptional regulator [Gemmatimonadota bacterium]|nr:MarR family transcriptional regulator [Gemmatimonadota bacterium]